MLSAEGAPGESESGLVEPLKVGPGSYVRNCRAKGKVKGTRPTCRAPSVGVSHPPRSYKSPYSDKGARIPGCVFLASGRKLEFGVRVIRLGNESKAEAAGPVAWTLGKEGQGHAGVQRPQAAARCPLGPDLGSAAAGPPESLLLQSLADRD